MIDLSQGEAAALLLRSFLSGLFLGLAYDLLKGIRLFICAEKPRKKSLWAVLFHLLSFVFDIAFFLAFAVLAIALCYSYVNGLFRGMVYLGMAAGVIIYRLTLSRVVVFLEKKATGVLRRAVRSIARLIKRPIVFLLGRFISLYHLTIGKILGKIISRIKDAAIRRKNTEDAPLESESFTDEATGKEEHPYGEGRAGYRASGRINFGDH